MTTTSDDRREVAARLRERECGWRKMGTHVSVSPDMPVTQFEDIAGLLGFNGGWILNADIFARLAALIDPTCHLLPARDGGFGCDRCYTGFSGMKKKPGYSPECGARVVER